MVVRDETGSVDGRRQPTALARFAGISRLIDAPLDTGPTDTRQGRAASGTREPV